MEDSMQLHVIDNDDTYEPMKLKSYDSFTFSPATGILVFFEKDTGEVILEWPRVKSLEMKISTSGWKLNVNRIPGNGF